MVHFQDGNIAVKFEDEIIGAMGEIFRQLNWLEEKGVPENRLNRIRRETLFFLYEGGGAMKWDEDRPHSKCARKLQRERAAKKLSRSDFTKKVTYEHSIPLATLNDGLKLAAKSDETLRSFLKDHIQGVIVTRDEEKRLREAKLKQSMPRGAEPNDKLARYRELRIEFEAADEAKLLK